MGNLVFPAEQKIVVNKMKGSVKELSMFHNYEIEKITR